MTEPETSQSVYENHHWREELCMQSVTYQVGLRNGIDDTVCDSIMRCLLDALGGEKGDAEGREKQSENL